MDQHNERQIESAIGERLLLDATGSWPKSFHKLGKKEVYAIIAAVKSGRPLLVRGEPGIGKSQLGRAAAKLLDRRFLSFVIQPDTEYQELLWSIDYTRRLADAQLVRAVEAGGEISGRPKGGKPKNQLRTIDDIGDSRNYIGPGPFWWAIDWGDAELMPSRHNYQVSEEPNAPDPKTNGVVLLVDEIDKADVALSNSLLEVLGNGRFLVPPIGKVVKADVKTMIPPLVVLTSNDTRQLPPALLRRCVTLNLKMPEDVVSYFVEIGQEHHADIKPSILKIAAEQIANDRLLCTDLPRTGLAEYLDLLKALDTISKNESEQREWLDNIADYFCKSNQPV